MALFSETLINIGEIPPTTGLKIGTALSGHMK